MNKFEKTKCYLNGESAHEVIEVLKHLGYKIGTLNGKIGTHPFIFISNGKVDFDNNMYTFSTSDLKEIDVEEILSIKVWGNFPELISGFAIDLNAMIYSVSNMGGNDTTKAIWSLEMEAKAAIALAQLTQWRGIYNAKIVEDRDIDYHYIKVTKNNEINIIRSKDSQFSSALLFTTPLIAEQFSKDFKDLILEAKILL